MLCYVYVNFASHSQIYEVPYVHGLFIGTRIKKSNNNLSKFKRFIILNIIIDVSHKNINIIFKKYFWNLCMNTFVQQLILFTRINGTFDGLI